MPLRPPAIPLFACDPYFSVWSAGDQMHAQQTTHWTGAAHPIVVLARIDGRVVRLVGARPWDAPALPQTRLDVWPRQTRAEFTGYGVQVSLTFWSPAFPDDAEAVSRAAAFVEVEVRALDADPHAVQVLVEVWPEFAVDVGTQPVTWRRLHLPGVTALAVGASDQRPLNAVGDDVRIDWGQLFLVAEASRVASSSLVPHPEAHASFAENGRLPDADSADVAIEPNRWREVATLDLCFDFGQVTPGGDSDASRTALLAYDEGEALEFLHRRLPPVWRQGEAGPAELIHSCIDRHATWRRTAQREDDALMQELCEVGGDDYAALAALCFRQCLGGQKLVADLDGTPLAFSKEHFSNGCMATVDVAYPTCPFFLCFAPGLLAATLEPIYAYAASSRWPHAFAPHDLGRYPKANGQVYGGGERSAEGQMPVEECGNMLIMAAALAEVTGEADQARRYWPQLAAWAAYLAEHGFDPADQLCTDDFAGRLAHNVNLSIKTAIALGGFAKLARQTDRCEEADRYATLARRFAAEGHAAARRDGGGSRLAFDQPDSWSQKYNLVWDRLLGLNLYPDDFAEREVAFYRTQLLDYGLPLDSRSTVTKLDWCVWSASLACGRDDFDALLAPTYRWVRETSDRVPLSDCHFADRPRRRSFQARGVVGGVFIRLLQHRIGQASGESGPALLVPDSPKPRR
jgi:hypothetical protein